MAINGLCADVPLRNYSLTYLYYSCVCLLSFLHIDIYCFQAIKETFLSFAKAFSELFSAENVVSNYSDVNKRAVLKSKTKTATLKTKAARD